VSAITCSAQPEPISSKGPCLPYAHFFVPSGCAAQILPFAKGGSIRLDFAHILPVEAEAAYYTMMENQAVAA